MNKNFVCIVSSLIIACGAWGFSASAISEEGSTEDKAVIRDNELYVNDEKVLNKKALKEFVENEYEACLEATENGYKDMEPEKGKEALITVEKYGGTIYAIQNNYKNDTEIEVDNYLLDLGDNSTKRWVEGIYYDHLTEAVESASIEWSYDIYTRKATQEKEIKLSEYEMSKDDEYVYLYTIHPLAGKIDRIEDKESQNKDIVFNTTGSEYAFIVETEYIDTVTDIYGSGVYKEESNNESINKISVKSGERQYTAKTAVEAYANICIENKGVIENTELAVGLSNKKVYSINKGIKSDGTYDVNVNEIGDLSEVSLTEDDIILEVQNEKTIAIVNKYTEVLDGNLVGRVYTRDELYEDAPTGYISESRMFAVRANVYSIDGMEDVIKYVSENNSNRTKIYESMRKANPEMYKKALKNLGMTPKTPYIVGGVVIICLGGIVALIVIKKKQAKIAKRQEREAEAIEFARIKQEFDKKNKRNDVEKEVITNKEEQPEKNASNINVTTLEHTSIVETKENRRDENVTDTYKESNEDSIIENDASEDGIECVFNEEEISSDEISEDDGIEILDISEEVGTLEELLSMNAKKSMGNIKKIKPTMREE